MEESLNLRVQLFVLDKVLASSLFLFAVCIYTISIVVGRAHASKLFLWFLGGMWNLKRLSTQMPTKLGMAFSNSVVVVAEKG